MNVSQSGKNNDSSRGNSMTKKSGVKRAAKPPKRNSSIKASKIKGGNEIISVVKPKINFNVKKPRSNEGSKNLKKKTSTNNFNEKELGDIYVGSMNHEVQYYQNEIKEHERDLSNYNSKQREKERQISRNGSKRDIFIDGSQINNIDDIDKNIKINDSDSGVHMFI